jgi:tetratricopeptide (TPR) repeat protein
MSEPQPRRAEVVAKILTEVVDLAPAARATRVAERCAGDEELRAVVDYLLEETGAVVGRGELEVDCSTSPDAGPAQGNDAEARTLSLSHPPAPLPRQVGRYKLLQSIGEGGFGSVFMAEQQTPIRREVAVKIVKAGMDTRQVIARFEAERQALAMMDHPGIAKVLDAGQTAAGRPFFAMELVRGVPVTDYCDRHRLTIRQRLELFADVCNAVQHAHQKGIIHRDLKPSNVLVTLHDGEPVPKVIDFGIAKATQARLTEKTLFTEYRQLIGTPEYMSPEQAEMSALDIDTRADIYSLGVLLYELLTGATPFRSQQLHSKSFAEIQRIIREVEPPKPSTQLRASGEALAGVAERRRTDARKIGPLVRGELDWVVMKCLEKDRTRRYETAAALAADVRHYLAGRPVLARPTSAAYRARKFVGRHRLAVGATAAVVLALVTGLLLASVGFFHARRDRVAAEQARAETLVAFRTLRDLLQNEPSPGDVPDGVKETIRRLDQGWLRDTPDTAATLRSAIGAKYLSADRDIAEKQFKAALDLLPPSGGTFPPVAADALAGQACLHIQKGEFEAANARLLQARAAIEAAGPGNGRDPSFVLQMLRDTRRQQGDTRAAREFANLLVDWELAKYDASLRRSDGDQFARANRARLRASRAQFKEAAEDLRRLVGQNPDEFRFQLLLGYLELYLGNRDAARERTRELLRLVKASKEAPNGVEVARFCLASGDYRDYLEQAAGLIRWPPSEAMPPPQLERLLLAHCLLLYRQGAGDGALWDVSPYLDQAGEPPGGARQEKPIGELLRAMCLRQLRRSGADAARRDARTHAAPPTWRDPETGVIADRSITSYLLFELLDREYGGG